ncbi:microprocessor complex subunit DGCR8 [Aedes aegypti]|uniref:DRBM domain-containing protein n=1 Tax=Aedes aegypti TaxID=7159 RepID=A0A6I8TZG1_AEDAE|nr:microprocessor complex subunit DGCR8 [Aedes aegypti]XP_021710924.1 microprocessor complex subunit DGCR8 [Aedes aegypti]XP_021710925.1 microprocessor complex subunit DGCR8 [Aedes aegypti]XP_021710926.1 microprocessor complex subunit DGCR8 [Aedes aegypti]XP_021710927.1 microprocessor complex subunit DGCR8 [Aedes aegypti]XP_021710928.1 microprocessor complex subunit DGCR8 [Aedes aegypti]XP_021710929.1 microprocessor complex subunit DGCR8 [Aedes aegypti]XP_021710930.1 microprocessor complex s
MDNPVPPAAESEGCSPNPAPPLPEAVFPAPPPMPELEGKCPSSGERRKPTMEECPYAKRRKLTAFFDDDDDLEEEDDDEDDQMAGQERDGTREVSERHEELNDQLRQFQVLDEVQGDNSEDENDEDQFDGDGAENSSEGSGVDIEELDNLLEENLPEGMKSSGPKAKAYEERFKEVLEEKGRNHFEVLPEGWVQATHVSGMPLFLHTASRVCTASRPYFLGPGSVRKHEIPLSAIPCLNYRKALEKEDELRKEIEANAAAAEEAQNNANSNDKENQETEKQMHNPQLSKMIASTTTLAEAQANAKMLPLKVTARIETVNENLKAQSLTADVFQEYCKKLFKFKTIRVMRFKSWAARRKLTKHRKHMKNLQRPTLPDGTKLITFPVLHTEVEKGTTHVRPKKEWIMNPNGKSYVCILHEYVQHALRKQPSYEFKELENAATPYSATVSINELKYGTGYGTSKKQAKSEAARETLEILIPDMKDKITSKDAKKDQNGAAEQQPEARNLSVFDEIKIEDPRVAEFCAKTTEPSPHAILQTCLQRNFGLGDVQIQYDVKAGKHRKNEFTMTVGKHTATVVCKNKRDGKQRASQAILQILHPHIKTWGSLLRLYGNHSIKSYKEKKQEEQEITVLQSKAAINQPNYAILHKLKLEMSKLEERQKNVRVIGTFVPDVDLPLASGSNLKNVDL